MSTWTQHHYTHGPRPTITYNLEHLKQKPLRYFCNVGRTHNGNRKADVKAIKDVCQFNIANGVECLTYYYLSTVNFPLQVQYLESRKACEVSIFEPRGQKLIYSKIIKTGKNGRIPSDESKIIGALMKLWSDRYRSALGDIYTELQNVGITITPLAIPES